MTALAPSDAVAWYTQALDLLGKDSADRPEERCRLLTKLTAAQMDAGDPTHRETRRQAGRLAQRLGDRDLIVAVTLTRIPGIDSVSEPDPERVELLEATLEKVGTGDDATRARCSASLSEELDPRDDVRRLALADDALATARRTGNSEAILDALTMTSAIRHVPELLDEQLADADEALALARATGAPLRYLDALVSFVETYVMATRASKNLRVQRCHLRNRQPHPASLAAMDGGNARGVVVVTRGADRRCRKAGERSAGDRRAIWAALCAPDLRRAQMLMQHIHRGRYDEIVELVKTASADTPSLQLGYRSALTWLYCHAGRFDDARPLFDQDADAGFAAPRDSVWLQIVCFWSESAFLLQRREVAADLYSRLVPFADQFYCTGAHDIGAVAALLGHLAHLLERPYDAEAHYRRALDLHESMRAPYWIARTQLDLADLLHRDASQRSTPTRRASVNNRRSVRLRRTHATRIRIRVNPRSAREKGTHVRVLWRLYRRHDRRRGDHETE